MIKERDAAGGGGSVGKKKSDFKNYDRNIPRTSEANGRNSSNGTGPLVVLAKTLKIMKIFEQNV